MTGANPARPVWLDDRLAGAIAYAKARAEADWQDIAHIAELGEILRAWDAAPTDSAEAAMRAWDNSAYPHTIIAAVLKALGMPEVSS